MVNESNHKLNKQNIKAGLYIVSTPIGNLEDITFRAINILKNSEYILCEDTRVSINLFRKYGINSKLISNHKFNEKKNLDKVLALLKKNLIISIISDSGTPAISDPGQLIIKECIKNKIKVFPIPGPTAVTSAVSISGFSEKYLFYGFLPNKDNEIEKELKELKKLSYSIVFFVSPKKINKILKHFKNYFNERDILICREMTKIYEEFIYSDIKNLNLLDQKAKGEFTVVISNFPENKVKINDLNESIKKEIIIMLKKYTIKDVVSFISKKENLSKKLIYDYCLKNKK
ncbi:MAG: 16S rRNA (cytidine(1402)-2'-O)-methyltransferase [Candidatus Pelagibacterales bacterium]|nr:MAG: 16S rRNA (cytidine(1402)-2'-O)-methyltransferase [Pelagibacterales bacterium]|tara:strand:- start:778 stop:1641 length:864 start_codon:yes stop_codon:yes gene_type:complete